jgi:uncharacterized protein
MVAIAVALPALSLIPLGSIWLWEHGYLLYWVGAALVVSILSFLLEAWFVGMPMTSSQARNGPRTAPSDEASWTPREASAWSAVELLAASIDPAEITDRDAFVDLGLRTIEVVARNIHPKDPDPLWRFTVPEALTLIERVSRELRPFVADTIPLGDQLTVAQVLKIYRWRSAIGVAEKAYDVWRIIRLINPVAAITNEARERLTKRLYSGVRDEFAKRMIQGFVREVGRAAIDLYGGRLRPSADELVQQSDPATGKNQTASDPSDPVRILVLGRRDAGTAPLISALLRRIGAHAIPQVGGPALEGMQPIKSDTATSVVFVDKPMVTETAAALRALSAEADTCDLVMWVGGALSPDRRIDRVSLDGIRAHFGERPDQRHPPMLAVVIVPEQMLPGTTPVGSDVANATDVGEADGVPAILNHAALDLAVPLETVVPVRLASGAVDDSLDNLWNRISALLPDARHTQAVRRRRDASSWTWQKVLSQTVNTGRVAVRALSKPKQGGK